MFQTPALIVMSIAATRMYRSLTDFSDIKYYAFCLLRSVLILTTAVVAGLSVRIQLPGGARQIQIPNGSSQRQFRCPSR
jgi:hypothetical protein